MLRLCLRVRRDLRWMGGVSLTLFGFQNRLIWGIDKIQWRRVLEGFYKISQTKLSV
jgi:hypothetical protein